jgi:eukaryotic-like serine/threonine-protein kinase
LRLPGWPLPDTCISARPLIATSILPPDGTVIDSSNFATPAISPDGQRIVFSARNSSGVNQLFLRRLDSTTAQPLPGTENTNSPFWSPDSRYVAFATNLELKKIDTQGGAPVTIAAIPGSLRGGAWNKDGVILIAPPPSPLLRVSASGGTPVPATANQNAAGDRTPFFLPDQKHFLYTAPTPEAPFPLLVGSLGEPAKRGKVIAQVSSSTAAYSNGHLLYVVGNSLMAQPFNLDRLELSGERAQVAQSVNTFGFPGRQAAFDVTASGILVYQTGSSAQLRFVWVDRKGTVGEPLGEVASTFFGASLSPNGKTLAAALITPEVPGLDLWLYDIARGARTRLTFGKGNHQYPVWTPDGASLIWGVNDKGPYRIVRGRADGTGQPEDVFAGGGSEVPTSVSPDGKMLLYYTTRRGDTVGGLDIFTIPLSGSPADRTPRAVVQSPGGLEGQFSPDGRWVAYQSNESGRDEIYVVPSSVGGGKRQISTNGGAAPRWRSDGKELFYLAGSGRNSGTMWAVDVNTRGEALEAGQPHQLFPFGFINGRDVYAPSPDGQRFLIPHADTHVTQPLTLVQNWTAMLKK